MPQIELSLHVAAPPERCFDLSRSVDAHTHSTKDTGERAVAGKTHGLLTLGDEVTWRAKHLGVWQNLTSRITAYDRPGHFRDSQVRGAFAHFDHDHFFTSTERGTLIREVLAYRGPLGLLGWIAERAFLTAYMRRFLATRLFTLKTIAESDAWVQFVPRAP